MTYGDSIVGTGRREGRTVGGVRVGWTCRGWDGGTGGGAAGDHGDRIGAAARRKSRGRRRRVWARRRSEEHTSELQSRVDLVCRLLLEKKKTREITDRIHTE